MYQINFFIFTTFFLIIQVTGKFWCNSNSTPHCKFETNKKCKDPSLQDLDTLFARKEFYFLDILELRKGSNDVDDIINGYPIFDYYDENERLKIYNHTLILSDGPNDCKYNNYITVMERSLCPWKENHMKRDNVYPFIRKFAECLPCDQECSADEHMEKIDGLEQRYKCAEIKNLELILYRSKCVDNQYTWEVGFEEVSNSCKCIMPGLYQD
jgi:hypothetical protein